MLTPALRRAIRRLSHDAILVLQGTSYGRNGDHPRDRIPRHVARHLFRIGLVSFMPFNGAMLLLLSDNGLRKAPALSQEIQ
jgi:hypothetical protein